MSSDDPNMVGPNDRPGADEPPIEPGAGEADSWDPDVYVLRDPPPAWSDPQPVVPAASAVRRGERKSRPAAERAGGTWGLMGCNLLVFATSVCIMVLELTASRLIAKHVGSSLYTWTSVIGVVLAGITLGNFLGGWLADRFNHRRTLGWLFLASSVLSFSVLWLDQLVGGLSRPAGWQWSHWVLANVAAVFLLPSVALGTISPVVASMALARRMKTGLTVGNVYAWGALGSIVGTFLTGFYLIDILGTKEVIALTAGSLALLGAVMAAGQWVFRAAVVFGWMQFVFVLGVAATATEQSAWLGKQLGGGLHEIGLTLRLRSDELHQYHDESNYSYINVGDSYEQGDRVKYLKLDKLIHSYYNPDKPTALYYDYEQVYAAVTERAANRRPGWTAVPLEGFPPGPAELPPLPEGVRYDADKKQLEVRGAMSDAQRDRLLSVGPSAAWWQVVDDLHRKTNAPDWGGFELIELDELPEGLVIPESLSDTVRYDATIQTLNAFGPVSAEDRERLIEAAPFAGYYRCVQQLHAKSRRVSTLFIGGGGFIFPRWIEAYFPERPRIDVAELDPAVKLAVQRELGLPPDDETAVNTFVGDARNFVDDRLRKNAELRQQGRPPVLYDFAYGDAFNDFSVPWHLTTKEFSEKVRELLAPDGVYLVNIIDMYPRTEYPGRQRGTGEAEFQGELPDDLIDRRRLGSDWVRLGRPFKLLEVRRLATDRFALRCNGVLDDQLYSDLFAVARKDAEDDDDTVHDYPEFLEAIESLYDQTQADVPFAGEIPPELLAGRSGTGDWQSCPAPYDAVELYEVEEAGQFVLGFRGMMSEAMRERLRRLAPQNAEFTTAVEELHRRSRRRLPGRFLGRYVRTCADVFPNVYVFSSTVGVPHDDRETFVIVCSMRPLDLDDLGEAGGHWTGRPFAWLEAAGSQAPLLHGQMESLLELSQGRVLEDNYAPVDNLLAPVFTGQSGD